MAQGVAFFQFVVEFLEVFSEQFCDEGVVSDGFEDLVEQRVIFSFVVFVVVDEELPRPFFGEVFEFVFFNFLKRGQA